MAFLAQDVKLQDGDLFSLVQQLRADRDYPIDPVSFSEGEDITCMSEEELIERMGDHLGVDAKTILSMAGGPQTHHDLVLLAHLAILKANQTTSSPPPLQAPGAALGDPGVSEKPPPGAPKKRSLPDSLKQGEAKKKVCLLSVLVLRAIYTIIVSAIFLVE